MRFPACLLLQMQTWENRQIRTLPKSRRRPQCDIDAKAGWSASSLQSCCLNCYVRHPWSKLRMTGGRSLPGIPTLYASPSFQSRRRSPNYRSVVESYCQDHHRAVEPGPFSPPDGILAKNRQARDAGQGMAAPDLEFTLLFGSSHTLYMDT